MPASRRTSTPRAQRFVVHGAVLTVLAIGAAWQLFGRSVAPPAADPPATVPATPGSAASQPIAATVSAAPPIPTAPLASATARPAPTATPGPLQALPADQRETAQQGQRLIAEGDYERALERLGPLADQVTAAGAVAEVRLLLAQAQVGDGRFTVSLATSDSVLAGASSTQQSAAARLMKGQALRGLGRWDDAAAEMRAAAEMDESIGAGVRLELAEMWLSAERADQAVLDAGKGLDIADPRLLKIEMAERLGRARVLRNEPEGAMDAYRQLLTAAGTAGYLGEQLYNLADGARALGKTEDAIRALRTSISDFPRSRKAPEAVLLLEQLGGMRPEDRFFAGLIRYYFWNFPGARADFDAYLAALPDGDRAVEARYYRGLSAPARDSIARLTALADQYPDDDFAPLALLEAGKAWEELRDYVSARGVYDRLVATYPRRDAGIAGRFRRGLARYMEGDLEAARSDWDALTGEAFDPPVRAQALYWSGKALERSGSTDGARAKWQAAAAVRPVDYYVVRARVALEPPPASAAFDPLAAPVADEAALGRWFAERGVNLDVAAREAAAQPAYQRAAALVRAGLFRQANWEHEALLTLYRDQPAHLAWLAARFGELSLPNAALKLGTAALRTATADGQVSVLDVPASLQRLAYPVAFPEVAAPTARSLGVDPLLFNALMRQESEFDPYAESVALAKGLTQIIPATGTEIAQALGAPDFTQESLFQPKRNLEFGGWYFSQRLKRNGATNRALAAYNAGDGNVDTWTGPGRDDPDVFAEYVAFAETHDYVKKIYASWMISRYVWAGG